MRSSLDISTSALVAQRLRLNTVSGNVANLNTLVNEEGKPQPYQARYPIFQLDDSMASEGGAAGVKVASVETDQSDPLYRYQPEHPLAIKDGQWKGYVAYPNIDMTTQMVDALEATRAYEANVGVIEITKNLGQQSLQIIA
jgi:flagellar basal-body rod protein FlgC